MLKRLATVVGSSESSTRTHTRSRTRTLEHGFKAGASSNNVATSQRTTKRSKRLPGLFDSVYKACDVTATMLSRSWV